MNTELLLAIADMIEAQPQHWDLSEFLDFDYTKPGPAPQTVDDFYARCDTTACVAGWATILSSEPGTKLEEMPNYDKRGREALDITREQAERLFYANRYSIWVEVANEYGWDRYDLWQNSDWSIIQADQAADVLRRIARGELTL